MKIFHPPLIPPVKGGKVPSSLVGEGQGEGYFRINTINTATWGKKGNWNSNQTQMFVII
jgi:hypothetical protein